MYEQEKARLDFERRVLLRMAQRELVELQIQKQRADVIERQRFKEELRYRMRNNTTKYLIPKKKTKIAIRNAAIKQQRIIEQRKKQQERLDLHVFTQRQIEIAQQIIYSMEGAKND